MKNYNSFKFQENGDWGLGIENLKKNLVKNKHNNLIYNF